MSQSILKIKLKKLLESVNYSYTHWGVLLGISKSAISQWFKEEGSTKPDAEHILEIKKIIESHNDPKLNSALYELYNEPIFEIDNGFSKYKALNLFDYACKSLIERIKDALIYSDVPSDEKIEYFEHLLSYIALSSNIGDESNIGKENRKLLSEIIELLINSNRRDEWIGVKNDLEKIVDILHCNKAIANKTDVSTPSESKTTSTNLGNNQSDQLNESFSFKGKNFPKGALTQKEAA